MLKPWSLSAAFRSSVRYPSGYPFRQCGSRSIFRVLSNLNTVLEAVELYRNEKSVFVRFTFQVHIGRDMTYLPARVRNLTPSLTN